jgi:hypothetical protein
LRPFPNWTPGILIYAYVIQYNLISASLI